MRLGYRRGSPYREKFLSSFLLLQLDTPCLSKYEIVGPRQYSSAKYIAMLRGRSIILFQVATRTRNSLIRPAVRYSIHDKRDPTYRTFYTYRIYSHVFLSRIACLFSTYTQKLFAT